MKRTLITLAALLLVTMIFPGTVCAAELDYPFSVEIIVPDNNIDRLGFYHVPGNPGDTIPLQAKLFNLTDQPIEILVIPLNAYTALDGISYQDPTNMDSVVFALADENYGLAQHIQAADTVHLAANASMLVDLKVSVPDISDGILLGGIRFAVFAGTQQVQNEEVDSSTILIDEYLAIDTAIQIDLPGKVQPSVTAGIPKLTNKGLCVPVVNGAAMIQENVTGTYQITNSQNTVLLEGSAILPKMAPMSEAHLFQPWDAAWKEGDYTLTMQISVNGQTFDYARPFIIGEEAIVEMEEGQQSAVNEPAQESGIATAAETSGVAYTQKTLIYIVVIGIPLLFISLVIWNHQRKRKVTKRAQARHAAGKRFVPN